LGRIFVRSDVRFVRSERFRAIVFGPVVFGPVNFRPINFRAVVFRAVVFIVSVRLVVWRLVVLRPLYLLGHVLRRQSVLGLLLQGCFAKARAVLR
jgi:hypothetical protein